MIRDVASASILFFLTIVGGLSPADASAQVPKAPDSRSISNDVIRRPEIIEIAKRYAQHKWRATTDNTHHGPDELGNQVDTPDESYRKGGFVVDAENVGIPYKWGGFSSIEQFDNGIRTGKLAGHLPKKGSSPASDQAVGVDCSGLVSRCWDLPRKHSTRSLGNICYELESFENLRPGDIVNSFDGHVVIFESFANAERTRISVYEAGGTRVERNVHTIARLKKKGFKPLRYKPLDPRWGQDVLAPADFVRDAGENGFFSSDNSMETDFALLEQPVSSIQVGDWASYSVGPNMESVHSVSKVASESVVIRTRYSNLDKFQWNERQTPADQSRWKALIDFAGFDQDFGKLELVASQVQPGHYQLGDRSFEANRIQLDIKGILLIRQIQYPVLIHFEGVLSDQVAGVGVITANVDVELRQGKKVRGKTTKKFRLDQFRQSENAAPK